MQFMIRYYANACGKSSKKTAPNKTWPWNHCRQQLNSNFQLRLSVFNFVLLFVHWLKVTQTHSCGCSDGLNTQQICDSLQLLTFFNYLQFLRGVCIRKILLNWMKSAHSGCKKRNRGRILIKNEKKMKKILPHAVVGAWLWWQLIKKHRGRMVRVVALVVKAWRNKLA